MGDFSDIRVATMNEGNGVAVDFIVKRNYYNNLIHIDGLKEPPTEAAALAALRLNLGEPFRESSLREAIGRLEDSAAQRWILSGQSDLLAAAARRYAPDGCRRSISIPARALASATSTSATRRLTPTCRS